MTNVPNERRGLSEPDTESVDSRPWADTSRRRFLRQSGALFGTAATVGTPAALAQSQGTAALEVPESMKSLARPIGGEHAYGKPSPFEGGVVRKSMGNNYNALQVTRTPLQDLDGIITPNGLFYERHHAGVPDIDPSRHRLMLHGMVKTPLLFSVDELRRFPSVSRINFLECSGNPVYTKPYANGR